MDTKEIRQQIVDIVKREYRNGMVNMFEGNVSARVGDRYFITPSQIGKETMTAEMVIEVDADGNIISASEGLKASSELKMHLEVYRLRPDVQAVVHNHSLYATAFAVNSMPIESSQLTEMNLTFGRVPVVPYGTPGTDQIYRNFKDYIGNYHGILLANHGLLTFGRSLELAYSYAEGIEKIARTIFIAKQLGTGPSIAAEEIEALQTFGEKMRIAEIETALQLQHRESR